MTERTTDWRPRLQTGRPAYLAIADSIAEGIRSGELSAGSRLPPLRSLAESLGLDFTTVSRAYGEARRRGLVEGRVGLGTFVQGQALLPSIAVPEASFRCDMSMNAPPLPTDPTLLADLRADLMSLGTGDALRSLWGYGDPTGSEEDRELGAFWLRPRLPTVTAETLLLCPGAQGALLALASTLLRAGEAVMCEALTYPGLKSLAAHLGIPLVGLAMDDEGLCPEAFAAACATGASRVLYTNPTLHNPTTVSQSLSRRHEIVQIARQYNVIILEDDAYGLLPESAPPPLAMLAPERTYYIAGLAKCVSPALRLAYLGTPDRRSAVRLATALRASSLGAAPLSVALARRWLKNGRAAALLASIQQESRERQRLAERWLPAEAITAAPGAFHLWLRLPEGWSRLEFVSQLRAQGVVLIASDAFAVGERIGEASPEAVRLCLGVLPNLAATEGLVRRLHHLLQQPPSPMGPVI